MIFVLPGQKYTPPGPQELELCIIPRWPRDSVNSDLLYWLLYNGGEFDLRQGLQSKLKTSSYPSGLGPMILRILVLFSSPFSSWEIPKYPLLSPKSLSYYQCYDHLWPSNGHPIRWAPLTSNDRCPHRGNDDAQRFQRIISHLTQATLLENFRDTWAIFMSCIRKDRGHTVQQGNWSFIFILGIQ